MSEAAELYSPTMAQLVRDLAITRGDAIAFAFEERTTSFADFDHITSRVANGLIAAGVADQARFAYLCRNTDRVFELVYGAHKAGAVPVGVNWRLAPEEAAYILRDSQSTLVFTDTASLELARAACAKAPCVESIIVLDGAAEPPMLNYEDWRDGQSQHDPHREGDAETVACQLYTSGTTGHPKGVLLTHANFIAQRRSGAHSGAWMNIEPDGAALSVMPSYHVGGLTMGTIAFHQGAMTVVSRDPDPARLLELIERWQVRQTFLVPAVIQALLNHPDCKPARLKSLRVLRYGAAPITGALLRQTQAVLPGALVQVYGMTEATGSVTCLPPSDHCDAQVDRRMRSCGKAMAHCEIAVLDPEGAPVAAGVVGEICVRARSIMKGYWNLPDATADAFYGDWYRSGDAGYLDEDGYVYLHDRLKDMIISGGENIYPAEVENALADHPAVLEAGVIGVPDDRWGEAVKAIVVLRPGFSASEAELIQYTRVRIAAFKAPKSIAFIEALPRNPSGKLLRRELRAPFWADRDRAIS